MTVESREWLNGNILVGFTDQNGLPWWYKQELQGPEPTVYPGPVPREDVLRRLFRWRAESRPIQYVTVDGKAVPLQGYRLIVHGETGAPIEVVKENYQVHQYEEWLLNRVSDIVDNSDVHIGSAGLLKDGAIAWVTIERPENVISRNGIELRPRILATTSHNGTLATTFKMIGTIVVCDNTLAAALAEKAPAFKVRHTRNSPARLEEIRDALGILVATGDSLGDFFDSLADVKVSDSQWNLILETLVPIPAGTRPQSVSRLSNKRSELDAMWRLDPRCSPWMGTGFGVYQVFNTFRLHVAGPDGLRMERNMRELMSSAGTNKDMDVIDAIESVTKTGAFTRS